MAPRVPAPRRPRRSQSSQAALPTKVFSIVDRDSDQRATEVPPRYQWPVYRIENFLISDDHIFKALQIFESTRNHYRTPDEVAVALLAAARAVLPGLVSRRLQKFANDKITSCIRLKFRPDQPDAPKPLHDSLEESVARVRLMASTELTLDALKVAQDAETKRLTAALADGSWRAEFPGREVLKQFVAKLPSPSINYSSLRDLVRREMADAGYKPAGMAEVIEAVLRG